MELASILTILILNIVLPTLDTATDINLVVKLYVGARHFSHTAMATAMLLPFLLNYVVCLYTSFRLGRTKKYALIFALLNLYPQFGETNDDLIISIKKII